MSDESYSYRVVEGWGLGSGGRPMGGVVPDVATDSEDRVYVTRREPPGILVYDSEGRYLSTLAEDILTNPHNIWIDPKNHLYVADTDDHTIRIFDTNGDILQTLGTPNVTGEPGYPFNRPTKAMRAPSGEIFVSDGYGQHRVHRFSQDGEYQLSWGEEGTGPAQFALPHDLWIDPRNRVMVTDRENHRIQFFDFDGHFLEEWTNTESPNNIHIDENEIVYVAESSRRLSLFDLDGNVLARWGEEGHGSGQFLDFPHGICVDSHGDIYVAEVPYQSDRLQKFTRE
jgi:sugar lactone lactonase YvrE